MFVVLDFALKTKRKSKTLEHKVRPHFSNGRNYNVCHAKKVAKKNVITRSTYTQFSVADRQKKQSHFENKEKNRHFVYTEMKLRFANTSEKKAKKSSKQAKQKNIRKKKRLKNPLRKKLNINFETRSIMFSHMLLDCLKFY